MFYVAPETIITEPAFRYKAVYVRVPFKISAKSMEYHDETGSKVFGMVQVVKHTGYDTGRCVEKAVKKRAVFQKEDTERFINSKNTMSVRNTDQFERHGSSAFHGIFCTTSGAEPAMTAEGNEF